MNRTCPRTAKPSSESAFGTRYTSGGRVFPVGMDRKPVRSPVMVWLLSLLYWPILSLAASDQGLESILEPVMPQPTQDRESSSPAPVLDEPTQWEPESDAPAAVPEAKAAVPRIHLGPSHVREVLANRMAEHYEVTGDFRIDLLRPWRAVPVAEGAWELVVTEFPATGLSSSTLIRFRLLSEGRTVGEWQMPLRCELWQEVLVATRHLNRDALPEASDFDVRRIDALRFRDALVTPDTELGHYELRETVSKGQPLLWRQLDQQPLVRKGSVVEVSAQEGLLSISMKGLALEDGTQDQFISVRNLESRRDFQAQIIGENRVRVYF